MAVSDVGAVLDFLRKNGFSDVESALRDDIVERGDLSSSDFEMFMFPIAPSLPPVRIRLGGGRQSKVSNGVDRSDSISDSSDDFVSIGSSTIVVSPSGLTNPYAVWPESGLKSEASSDRLSEFGTARDYYDSDILYDTHWYSEKDGGCPKNSSFRGPDFFGCPSQDKYVTASEAERQCDRLFDINYAAEGFHSVTSINCLDKERFNDAAMANGVPVVEHYQWNENVQQEHAVEAGFEDRTGCYSSADPLCDCCKVEKDYYRGEYEDYNHMKSLKDPELKDLQLKLVPECTFYCDSNSEHQRNESSSHSIKKGFTENVDMKFCEDTDLHLHDSKTACQPYGDNDYVIGDGGEMIGEPADASGIAGDDDDCASPIEHLAYDIDKDEYEIFNLRIIHRKNRTGFEENKDLPIVLNSVIAGRYYVTEYLGSAAFSRVVQAHDLHNGVDVCLKIIKNDKDFFDQSLDEIKLLKFVNKHDPADEHHILRLYDYFYHQEHLFIVCELLRANLYEFQRYNQESGGEVYFTLRRLQIITQQCLEALDYLHGLGIIHCDLKPENILIKSYSRCEIKIIDLGSSCFQTDNLCLYVQSRSYRAPEVILGLPYDQRIDIWSLGCVLAELCSGDVLFPNDAPVIILARMIGMLGPIDMEMLVSGQETDKYFTKEYDLFHVNEETNQLEYIIPEESSLEHHLQVSDVGFIEFISYLLEINPQRRPTAKEALQHPWLSCTYE
ncbi:dual specificity protein kinase CLK1 [Macadamia integrifolia]|uniref:dual specificity protein kinase CLK1 n=1 Tax=Macadamia integrifolia TaxID=60698 RepID=UPI001C4F7E62|nr:dual specificity protein kinase CLK1 [Macadamia integrifolia]